MPKQYQVTLAGVVERTPPPSCGQCNQFNATFTCSFFGSGLTCIWKTPLNFCAAMELAVEISGTDMYVRIGGDVVWKKTNIKSCLEEEYNVPFFQSPVVQCDFTASTCTVKPVAFSLATDSASDYDCLPAMQPGLGPGKCEVPVPVPDC
jgi:hypothetical protein